MASGERWLPMKLIDADVLIYVIDQSSDHHAESRQWLNSALTGRVMAASGRSIT